MSLKEIKQQLDNDTSIFTITDLRLYFSQKQIADMLGLTPQGIQQIQDSGRKVFVELDVAGKFIDVLELKTVGRDNGSLRENRGSA